MENKILYREITEKKKGNKIFHEQKASDLAELKKLIVNMGELVVDFSLEEWNNIAPMLMKEHNFTQIQATRNYIAFKTFNTLKEKYPQLDKYSRNYNNQKVNILAHSLNFIKIILELENIEPERIHFIMNGNKSQVLCDALTILLSDDSPFNVSIYTSPNVFYTTVIPDTKDKVYLWEEYNYTNFYGNKEGEKNIATRPKVKRK